jgi:Protein of unknown function (DUF2523)
MPILVAWICSAGVWLVESQIGRMILLAMAWFGLNYVTIKVVLDPVMDVLHDVMNGAASASGGYGTVAGYAALMYSWMVVLKFPGALTMVCSAYITKAAAKSGSGFFKKVSPV